MEIHTGGEVLGISNNFKKRFSQFQFKISNFLWFQPDGLLLFFIIRGSELEIFTFGLLAG